MKTDLQHLKYERDTLLEKLKLYKATTQDKQHSAEA